MKNNFSLILCTLFCLSTLAVHAQLIQSSSLITTVEKLKPVKRGYQSHVQFSYSMINPESRTLDLSAAYIGGFRFNNMFYLGAGAEIQYADCLLNGALAYGNEGYMPRSEVFLPLFVHFRTYFLEKRVSPFFALSGGYAIGFPNSKEFEYNGDKRVKYTCGTLFAEPTLGVNTRITHKTSLYLSFSYRIYGLPHMKNVEWSNDSGYKSFDVKQKTAGSLRLNIGVTF